MHGLSVPITGSLEEDLAQLQGEDIVPDGSPNYILVKLDAPSADWMIISYVPDSAKVRDKASIDYSIFLCYASPISLIDAVCFNTFATA